MPSQNLLSKHEILTPSDFAGNSLFSVDQLSKEAIIYLLDQTLSLRKIEAEIMLANPRDRLRNHIPELLKRKLVYSVFFGSINKNSNIFRDRIL